MLLDEVDIEQKFSRDDGNGFKMCLLVYIGYIVL